MIVAFFSSCEGGTCAATDNPLTDADSDCVEDSGDNCPLVYNPDQFDGDEDGQGFDCDSDDNDEAVAVSLYKNAPDLILDGLTLPTNTTQTTTDTDCTYFAMGCGDVYLGLIADGNRQFAKRVLNPLSPFARSFAACSAFNSDATFPPAVYCEENLGEVQLVGYLTLNPDVDGALATCDFLDSLDIQTDLCAGL